MKISKQFSLVLFLILFLGLISKAQSVQYSSAYVTTTEPVKVSPPASGHASDQWVKDGKNPWQDEQKRRENELYAFINDTDPDRAKTYGFRAEHTPKLAWNWFDNHPIGYGGIPYVLLQTILSLDPATETNPHLLAIAKVWKKKSVIPSETGKEIYTIDHLGFGPHPDDYENGVAKDPSQRSHLLPNGLVYDPTVEVENLTDIDGRLNRMRDGLAGKFVKGFMALFGVNYEPKVGALVVLAHGKLRKELHGDDIDYEKEHHRFQQAPKVDPVFFSCTGCHVGRVIVGGELNNQGEVVEPGKMKFMPGMPNTEAETQYFSADMMLQTGLALVESGFSINATTIPKGEDIVVSQDAVTALYTRLLDRAIDANTVKTIYGSSPEQIKRAKIQTYWVAKDFPTYLGNIVSSSVKAQFAYYQMASNFAYNPNNPRKANPDQEISHIVNDRMGQMDAFGMVPSLVFLHSLRPDNSFIKFLYQDNPDNPLFSGIDTVPGFSGPVSVDEAGARIRKTFKDWVSQVPAPIDIKSLNWSGQRELANWDGNQGAEARTLASGTSATGDPRKTNVRIHEPLNPLINNLPPPPYPFNVDKQKALRGMAIFNGEGLQEGEQCSGCHLPNNPKIYPVNKLGVDENRSLVTSDIARYGLAGVVMEACKIFIRNNPGNDWCLPRDKQGNVITDWEKSNDDYFKDIPGRVRAGTHGYKADMLHGIWARAPYLHNGSVPTLMHLVCPDTRPKKFNRGIVYYDQDMVGFVWDIIPKQRYSPYDIQLVKTYDTSVFSRSNAGHKFGSGLCPDVSGLDPTADREKIVEIISSSKAADLLEYLKTL